ncbi:hypothetical protein BDN71DRAFT_1460637 [Pleurotus eryngii]|uniref:DBF4-type domain-containing protein n=1 Tax=Pleurotus eryngii TaxID=5323 RepID=A0A9P6ACD7_PLEER|nr:hypothetical protein BDN71DRAFT_1460637 [Pleurotus eryngii]
MAAALPRRPLAERTSFSHEQCSAISQNSVGSAKRARSPEPHPAKATKRIRPLAQAATTAVAEEGKGRKKVEREQQKAEFREKYTKAFPSWVFYFDPDILDVANTEALRQDMKRKIHLLGGRVDDFFSKDITHLITDQVPGTELPLYNKENVGKSKNGTSSLLKSPIKLRGRIVEDVLMDTEYSLINKAQSFGQKIWTLTKLSSVVDRCLATPSTGQSQSLTTSVSATTQQSLSRLLQSERLNGTCERDPSERRHDFRYFSKDSYFVLVEDLHQEFATIAAHEYPVPKPHSATKPLWPILHCHPHARGPFIEFDEKERRRWEKTQQAESAKEKQALHVPRTGRPRARPTSLHLQATGHGDLRRSVSMNNIRRRASHPNGVLRDANLVDLDADEYDNDLAYASGYLASGISGHAAASGNSVGLTSTAGTTSTTGTVRNALQLTATLRGRLQQHVVTSKKFPNGEREGSNGPMAPPDGMPGRTTQAMLRKSRSTNTIKLPRRDEGSKPGYCESCRIKFDDFRKHVKGTKHKRFAANDDNFLQLDFVLARVKRCTDEEVRKAEADRESRWRASQSVSYSG